MEPLKASNDSTNLPKVNIIIGPKTSINVIKFLNIKSTEKENRSVTFDAQVLADKLHVGKREVVAASLKGNEVLVKFIEDHIEAPVTEVAKSVDEIYKSILERFSVVNNELVYKDDNTPTGITPEDLEYAVANPQGAFKYWRDETGKQRYINLRIGQGAYSKIYIFIDVNEAVMGVFKDAKRKSPIDEITPEVTKRDVQIEFQNLKAIHGEKSVAGVQFKPRQCGAISLTSKKNLPKERYGYIGYSYNGDYFDDIKENKPILQERLSDIYQLLSGLKSIHEKGFLHGDIKPENIFVKQLPDKKLVHIADLGGARNPKDVPKLTELVAGAGVRSASPGYTLLSDLNKGIFSAGLGERQKVIDLEQKRDVFAMGCVLFIALTGFSPFDTEGGKFPDEYLGFPNDEVPNELKYLIESMLSKNPALRPSAEMAFNLFDMYVSKSFPELASKVQQQFGIT